MTTTVPFTALEEAVFNIERASVPWNVQLEVTTSERIDRERLEAATVAACVTHPLARARRRPHDGWDSRYVWEIPDDIDDIPIREVSVDDGETLAAVRTAFHGESFELTDDPPPFRLLVAHDAEEDGGDRLLLSASHVAVDGVGALRILRSICRAYRGAELESDPIDLEPSRAALEEIRPDEFGRRLGLLGEAASHLRGTVEPPTRIAGDGGGEDLGWGFLDRRLDAGLTERIVEGRPEGVSVNDVLLAALHLTIDRWNRDHGEKAGKISLMMPMNLRPREWFYDVVGMYATFESVTTRSRHREDPEATVECVAEQTSKLKAKDRQAALVESLSWIPNGTPVGLKQQFPHLLRGPGEGLLDTAVLSNLGRVPNPTPTLDGGDPETLAFSPPAWKPIPVGVGVVTVDGTIHLTVRYLQTLFDHEAAIGFTELYLDRLSAVASAIT